MPMSKTHAMCTVCPKCGGKVETHPNTGDCYVSIITSKFLSQCPMCPTHGMQIKRVTDVLALGGDWRTQCSITVTLAVIRVLSKECRL